MRKKFELGENSRMAFENLRDHKTRSVLTILGVVIGVTALISVASILVGLDADVRGYLNDYGPDSIFVFRFTPGIRFGRLSAEERARKPLTLDMANAVGQLCPAVKNMVVEVFPRVATGQQTAPPTARYQNNEVFNVEHTGTLPSYEEVYNAKLIKGRFFDDGENLHRMDVAVIGYDLQDGLFPNQEPVGKEVIVGGVSYRVVGVLAKRKGQLFRDDSADKQVLVPYETYRKHHPYDDEHFIGAQAYAGHKAEAEDQIRGVLRRMRGVPYDKPDNFGVSTADQIANQFRQIMGMIALVTVVISSTGLLVGGVGVMNIMLMSVTERTREIGVRKAIGARQRDIIRQFLTEAMALTGAGGMIGVLLGATISLAINLMFPKLPSSVPSWAILSGVGVSMTIGLFFGMYPAVKAAKLDPVEALRYE